MPIHSKCKRYSPSEINLERISNLAFEELGQRPFQWQLEATLAILTGNDVILDVGTGCGKSLCFSLPLLLSKTDISLTVSPLTALMIDQVSVLLLLNIARVGFLYLLSSLRKASTAKIPTVAVCKETLSRVGADRLYQVRYNFFRSAEILNELQDIIEGKFRQVIVSPEIATSSDFHRGVTSKTVFTDRHRVVNIDEAHCINIWGGSFRPDYSELGVLRGRIPKNVPFLLASATLPEHILDDIRLKLQLPKDVKMVRVTNARPNVALSVRAIKKKEKSMGDLRFLIPPGANKPEDIKITLVYCNQRGVAEDGADYARDWAEEHGISTETIAFYHALVGEKRKREIEQKLARGEIHILFCTDAVGMVSFGP